MIIVFSTDTLARGGKERQISLLAKYLQGRQIHYEIFSKNIISGNNFFPEYNLSENQVKTYSSFNSYKDAIKNVKPDVVISWDIKTSMYNLLLYHKFNFKFINGSIRHGIRLIRPDHLYRSILCHLSPYIIANSFAGLRANNLRLGNNRFVLYNGIENKFRNTLSIAERDDLKEKFIPGYSLNPGIVYISISNFAPYKDFTTVLRSMSMLKKKQAFYYLIIGDGPLRAHIEAEINDYRLQENVILVGRTENINEYLFASDMLIHSSRGEGISNAILEGMYAGLPIIATKVGGVLETVYPASALLFSYKDYETLYYNLLKAPQLISSFNPLTKDYQAHLRKFSIDTMVNKFDEIINMVTSNR